jgi:hypothetical protein
VIARGLSKGTSLNLLGGHHARGGNLGCDSIGFDLRRVRARLELEFIVIRTDWPTCGGSYPRVCRDRGMGPRCRTLAKPVPAWRVLRVWQHLARRVSTPQSAAYAALIVRVDGKCECRGMLMEPTIDSLCTETVVQLGAAASSSFPRHSRSRRGCERGAGCRRRGGRRPRAHERAQ